jgi:predicted small lipoprotein YifL
MSDPMRRLMMGAVLSLLAGCGQTGKLYLPEKTGEIVTRPTQTPAETADPDKEKDKDKKNVPAETEPGKKN